MLARVPLTDSVPLQLFAEIHDQHVVFRLGPIGPECRSLYIQMSAEQMMELSCLIMGSPSGSHYGPVEVQVGP